MPALRQIEVQSLLRGQYCFELKKNGRTVGSAQHHRRSPRMHYSWRTGAGAIPNKPQNRPPRQGWDLVNLLLGSSIDQKHRRKLATDGHFLNSELATPVGTFYGGLGSIRHNTRTPFDCTLPSICLYIKTWNLSVEWWAFSNRSSLEGCFIMRKGGTCVCEPHKPVAVIVD